MSEIRTIRREEAEPFLKLLCEVFDLDFERASGIFFNEPLYDLNRKWALFDGGKMASILTTVPLEFGWGRAIGIAGVATCEESRRRGFAAKLLHAVLAQADAAGEGSALLFAKEPGLYQRCGFETLDTVIRAPIRSSLDTSLPDILSFSEVEDLYERWAAGSPNRLRRTETRWSYWKWNLKVCASFAGGYLCAEGNQVREAVTAVRTAEWPVPLGSEWVGLSRMAAQLCIPIGAATRELFLMARSCPGVPEMFMTDQF